MWIISCLAMGCCLVLLLEYRALRIKINRLNFEVRDCFEHLDDQFDQLSLVFSDFSEGPTAGQIQRAETGLVLLMDDLMKYQEKFQKAV